jgi:hypothetical protein
VWDARFFIDAELGEDVRVADTPLVRNVGFTFEWDLVRLGNLSNRVGELYSDFQGLGDSPWANLQVGRFEIPVGENYLRFSKGYRNNPFITNTVGGPWYWDEGVRLYGADPHDRFGYVASISDGETGFNADENADYQYTLKLFANATDWLHLSLSGEYTGRIGSKNTPGQGALWLGESWARAFGSGTSVDNYDHGVIVNDGPNRIDETYLLGADGLGTYDANEGYLLDFRYRDDLGYDMESLNAYSAVVGWKMLRYVTVRAEYSHVLIDLVRGVPESIGRKAGSADSWGLEVGVHF